MTILVILKIGRWRLGENLFGLKRRRRTTFPWKKKELQWEA